MEAFTTDDVNCPIEIYQASGLQSGITVGTNCPSVPDSSGPCRNLRVDTGNLGDYVIIFKIKAKGGNEVNSSPITISVNCPNTISISESSPL